MTPTSNRDVRYPLPEIATPISSLSKPKRQRQTNAGSGLSTFRRASPEFPSPYGKGERIRGVIVREIYMNKKEEFLMTPDKVRVRRH
jgi:hypothetical protein